MNVSKSVNWVVSAVLAVIASSVCNAQEEKKANVNPSGTWKWERTIRDTPVNYALRLNLKKDKLTGTFQSIWEGRQSELTKPVKIDDAKIDGDSLSFSVARSFNENEFVIEYSGQVKNDKIAGTVTVDFGSGQREFDWAAKRVVEIADVIGDWNVKIEAQGNVIESSMSLSKDGELLKGVYHSSVFGDHEMKNVALKDKKLSFSVAYEANGTPFPATYTFEPRGDAMTGTLTANVAGQQNEAQLVAQRVIEKVVEKNE